MEHTPQLSEYGDGEDLQQEEDTICQDKCMEPDTPDNYSHLDSDVSSGSESFACQHCERCFTSHQALEEHIHSHSLMVIVPETFTSKKGKIAPGLDFDQLQCDSIEPTVSLRSDVHHENMNAPACSTVPPDDQVYEHHPCSCCEKIFTTNANKQQHESTVHKKRLQIPRVEQSDVPQKEHLKQIIIAASNHRSEIETEVVGNEVESTGNYMLDVSSSFSENLSFYLNGKIVSTSTVSGYEAAEVHAACSTLIGLDTLILDPTHLNMGLTIDSILSNQELLGQALAKRRIAVPPLLPQIQTELESEVVVSSSSSEIVASLIENILPKNTGSSLVASNSTDVFLSPKLDQIQETQDTLLTDGQTDCSSVSTATGRFKRRTGSPQSSHHITASDEETAMAETDGDAATLRYMDTQYSSILHQLAIEKGNGIRRIQETQAAPVSTESWPPVTADKSCSQQPLDLSNTITRNEVDSSYDAALDLSLQKRNLEESQLTSNLLLPSEDNSNVCMQETAVLSVEEQNISLANHETPFVSDLTIVTSPNMVDTVTEGVVYGLSLPSCPQKFSPATHTPLGFPPASPCTITFAPPTTNAVLPNTPSLITVLAPPLSIPSPSSQPIQVLAPNISPEPLLLCAENAIDSSQCDITPAFAATNAANIVTLAHPLDPLLNLPGHMFLTDHISLNPPVNEDHNMPEIPFTTTAALNEPLINSCNITSNTVLIECTISLDSPGNIPAAVTMHDNTEPPLSTQMLVNHIEQQQIVSLPNTATVDPTHLMSSIEESVTLSSSTSVMTDRPAKNDEPEQGLEEDNLSSSISVMKDCPTKAEESEQGLKKDTLSSSTSQMIDCPAKTEEPKQSLEDKSANADEKKPADSTDSAGEITSDNSNPVEKAEETKPQNIAPTDTEQQTFAKNFICNVCNVLFHSMKELGHHVSDHAEEWPYKCEFCVLLFDKPTALLDHRSSLHGVDKTYMCSACPKDFVYLCNLKQHQEEFHPAQQCTFTEEEKGKIRHQNYNHSTKVDREPSLPDVSEKQVKKEDSEVDVAAEELFTTIKIMASDGGKLKVPDVRLGINQHYPSFKPPPFPYHNRSPAGSLASATNFTTHNIPQTFSTAIRCTKCGKSFDNMPELHKHILACASASDKRRYTPKKNPIPLRHFAKKQNGVLSLTNSENESNASNRASQSNGSTTESSSVKIQLKLLNKRKRKLGQRVMPQRNKSLSNKISPSHVQEELFVCPHCSREFTMQRSRTKHMAVCPKKPREVRTRKSEEISVTKENNGQIHSGLPHINEQRISAQPRTRLQTSTPVKRPNSPPLLKSISSKRPKLEDAKMDISTLNELHVVRSFNRPLRQYTRLHHGIKQIPSTQQNETHAPSREETTASGSS
ncbi:PR domain zinc finger protein 2 [Corythoichthys intestinalis]|uniref:PR domain zinc finger protein 2 n=1 Tax=Corythoichthys intestinalis TaxID=161448 RepID=UPI0025A50C12|nr:PR domain zinc finger protein 2 [Corythoichthys intestinalis]XP_057684815.1 PR domain zinc finger protein 2 [Corythoichthys intestinalis]